MQQIHKHTQKKSMSKPHTDMYVTDRPTKKQTYIKSQPPTYTHTEAQTHRNTEKHTEKKHNHNIQTGRTNMQTMCHNNELKHTGRQAGRLKPTKQKYK